MFVFVLVCITLCLFKSFAIILKRKREWVGLFQCLTDVLLLKLLKLSCGSSSWWLWFVFFVSFDCCVTLHYDGTALSAFSKFYHRHSELIVKYNIGLKTLLQQGILEPIFYGDLVYKFKRIVGNLILAMSSKR